MKLEHILVATDFSEAGKYALAEAASWARRYRSSLHVVHVVPPKRWFSGIFGASDSMHEAACELAAQSLKRLTDSIDTAQIREISTGVMEGAAARTIIRAARELSADLLVIGARGEHLHTADRMGLGGTAAKVVHTPPVPTLLVRREFVSMAPVVLAPVDLTPISSSVLQWAFRCSHDGEMQALHVYEVPFSGRLRTYGIAESAIEVYSTNEHARRTGVLAELIAEANPPSTIRIRQAIERVDSSETLLEHIRDFTGTVLVLGKHVRETDRVAPNYKSVCDYAARSCPANVLIIPA